MSHVNGLSGPLKCDGAHECMATVTHVDEKGYVYCRAHGIRRKSYRRCRQLTAHETKILISGGVIYYDPKRNLSKVPEVA